MIALHRKNQSERLERSDRVITMGNGSIEMCCSTFPFEQMYFCADPDESGQARTSRRDAFGKKVKALKVWRVRVCIRYINPMVHHAASR